ncbi:MAG: CHC2 zinc finger domain-containing protein [Chloroflexi bacterium]|nr:CHC2 zinc finger domain-containing protein [Chloroflexota bacterium]
MTTAPARVEAAEVAEVKRRRPIGEVIAGHGVELRPQGGRLAGRCPFHEDRSPSMVVYPETQSYYCFGCGAGGDAIDFVRRAGGLGFREALARLRQEAGAAPGVPAAPRVHRRPAPQPLSLDDRVMLAAACELYHETLGETPEALRYLEERGIPPWLQRARRLGVSDGSRLVPYLKRRRLSLRRARELGLLSGSGDEAMSGRLVIPDLRGAHCGWMVGRALSGGRTPKYRALSLARPLLGHDRRWRRVFLTEGPFDWLTLTAWGLPACALLGTHAGGGVLRQLDRARSVVLVMDSDDPGREAAARLQQTLGERARVLELPEGASDVNELAMQPGGREAFFRLLDAERDGRHGTR